MNEVNEILGNNNQSRNYNYRRRNYSNRGNYNNRYSNGYYNQRRYKDYSHNGNYDNNWQQKLNQDRQQIYKDMDEMTFVVSKDSQKFEEYLNIQSKFYKHSVGNCLVILKNAPNSIHFKDKKSWHENGVQVIRNAKSFQILEPNVSKTGTTYWNPKEVFDISQTTAKRMADVVPNHRKLLEAMIETSYAKIQSTDRLADGSLGAEYDKDQNIIYVCRKMDNQEVFEKLFQEIAKVEMRDDEQSPVKDFRSYCISYMMCQKYGIDSSNYHFENLPEEITAQRQLKDVRSELEVIRSNFENITERISDYLEKDSPKKERTDLER